MSPRPSWSRVRSGRVDRAASSVAPGRAPWRRWSGRVSRKHHCRRGKAVLPGSAVPAGRSDGSPVPGPTGRSGGGGARRCGFRPQRRSGLLGVAACGRVPITSARGRREPSFEVPPDPHPRSVPETAAVSDATGDRVGPTLLRRGITPTVGLAVVHLFFRTAPLRTALGSSPLSTPPPNRATRRWVARPKADLIVMALSSGPVETPPTPDRPGRRGLDLVDSYVSLTESSEYAEGIPRSEAGPAVPAAAARGGSRCSPLLPDRSGVRSAPTGSSSTSIARSSMYEHGASGRKFWPGPGRSSPFPPAPTTSRGCDPVLREPRRRRTSLATRCHMTRPRRCTVRAVLHVGMVDPRTVLGEPRDRLTWSGCGCPTRCPGRASQGAGTGVESSGSSRTADEIDGDLTRTAVVAGSAGAPWPCAVLVLVVAAWAPIYGRRQLHAVAEQLRASGITGDLNVRPGRPGASGPAPFSRDAVCRSWRSGSATGRWPGCRWLRAGSRPRG